MDKFSIASGRTAARKCDGAGDISVFRSGGVVTNRLAYPFAALFVFEGTVLKVSQPSQERMRLAVMIYHDMDMHSIPFTYSVMYSSKAKAPYHQLFLSSALSTLSMEKRRIEKSRPPTKANSRKL
jgi:hypothetical protein